MGSSCLDNFSIGGNSNRCKKIFFMKQTIEEAVEKARIPGKVFCQSCKEDLFSPMDKLSIFLYGECPVHLEEGGHKEKNLLKIAEIL